MENTFDLKSNAFELPGSSPGASTTIKIDPSNKKKQDRLGMPYGTANNKLKKNLMFYMAIQLKMDKCFHCKELIISVNDFSIEHKKPWLNSDNPIEKFFDLSNIAFSHLRCNVEASEGRPKLYISKEHKNISRHIRLKNDPVRYERALKLKREGYHKRKK